MILRSLVRSAQLGILGSALLGGVSCGHSGGGGGKDDVEIESSAGTVTLSGLSAELTNPMSGTATIDVSGAHFAASIEDVHLFINGVVVPPATIALQPDAITFPYSLQEGKNEIFLVAADEQQLPITFEETYWAGPNQLTVLVRDEAGQPVTATVNAKLVDDPRVLLSTEAQGGQASFVRLPERTFILSARDDHGRFGTTASVGTEGTVVLTLLGFAAPSTIDNNDFHLGTADGWNVGTAPVQIIEHRQDAQVAPDWDLELSTFREGPQSISRCFTVKSETKNVRLKYRFITSEIPGGYFGTQFNDYFSVTLRTRFGGGFSSESNSMNGLGLGAFDANGATVWREVSLPVSEQGDTLQVDVTVANVADSQYDSQVVVDRVDENDLAITQLNLADIDGRNLEMLSCADHLYFNGNTRIHGRMTVQGEPTDAVSEVRLEVVQDGAVVATGELADNAKASLLQPFGDDGKVETSGTALLFEIAASQAASVDSSTNGTVSLRVVVVSAAGDQASKDYGLPVTILARFTGTARYGSRDEAVGGDDWITPDAKAVLDQYTTITVGDISNMNGGPFAPHASHRRGVDLDGWFDGYNARNAATAATIIEHLNDPDSGSSIQCVYVTYQRTKSNPFWQAIKGVQLADGRQAKDVILPLGGHTTHFHWRLSQ